MMPGCSLAGFDQSTIALFCAAAPIPNESCCRSEAEMKLARTPPPPFAQLEQSRVANVTIPKSIVLASQVLRILSRKGFTGVVSFENLLIISLNLSSTCIVRRPSDACHWQTESLALMLFWLSSTGLFSLVVNVSSGIGCCDMSVSFLRIECPNSVTDPYIGLKYMFPIPNIAAAYGAASAPRFCYRRPDTRRLYG
jgi:hypothetical protein